MDSPDRYAASRETFRLELSGPSVTTRSGGTSVGVTSEGAVRKGPGGSGVNLGAGSVGLTSSGASLQLDGAATITGASIALTSPSAAGAGDDKDKAEVTTIELVDEQGHPVPSRPVVLRLDDGTERGAVVGPDGTVAIHDLSSDGTLVVVDAAGQGESTKPELAPHVVKQGEYLTQLAAALGFDRDTIWNDAKNAEVKALRPDPDLLAPGDVVYLPGGKPKGKPLSKGTHNRFVVEAATIEVLVRLQDHEGKALANVPCEVEGLASYGGAEVPTTTDGDGALKLVVPTWLRTVSVHLPHGNVTYRLSIGTQDPIEEPSGVRKRLVNLGYLPMREDVTGDDETELALALAHFQSDQGLPPTGQFDEPTRAALLAEHGL